MHKINGVLDVEMNLTGLVCTTSSIIYLYLVLDVPLNRDYIGRYRLILSRLFSAMKRANSNAVITLYDSQPECLNNKIHYYCNVYIGQLSKIPKAITQL